MGSVYVGSIIFQNHCNDTSTVNLLMDGIYESILAVRWKSFKAKCFDVYVDNMETVSPSEH